MASRRSQVQILSAPPRRRTVTCERSGVWPLKLRVRVTGGSSELRAPEPNTGSAQVGILPPLFARSRITHRKLIVWRS